MFSNNNNTNSGATLERQFNPFKTLIFQNTQYRHKIACPWGTGVECLSRIQKPDLCSTLNIVVCNTLFTRL